MWLYSMTGQDALRGGRLRSADVGRNVASNRRDTFICNGLGTVLGKATATETLYTLGDF